MPPSGQSRLDGLPRHEDTGRPILRCTLDEHEVARDALAVLQSRGDVYARFGRLVRVVDEPDGPGFVQTLSGPAVRERLTESSVFTAPTFDAETKKFVDKRVRCPTWLLQSITERGSWNEIPALAAVVHTPVFRADGSIHDEPGYDATTRVAYCPRVKLKKIPTKPSLEQSLAAMARVREAVAEFKWATPNDEAAWFAAFLSPFVQYAVNGPAPLFLVDKNTQGAGSGMLCDVVSLAHSGYAMERSRFPSDEEELAKSISTSVLEGDRWCMLDNLKGKLGGQIIEIVLTSERWKARLLGTNTNVRGVLNILWFATANNASMTADVARRTLQMRLEVDDERPDRVVFKKDDLPGWCLANRAQLIEGGLTMLRGWIAAGGPKNENVQPWGSYQAWNRWVPQCLAWLGFPGLELNRERVREDGDDETPMLAEVLLHLEKLCRTMSGESEPLTAGAILERVYNAPERWKSLRMALEGFTKGTPNQQISTRRLGLAFAQVRNKRCGGRRLVRSDKHSESGFLWYVERNAATPAADPETAVDPNFTPPEPMDF